LPPFRVPPNRRQIDRFGQVLDMKKQEYDTKNVDTQIICKKRRYSAHSSDDCAAFAVNA
jgi:hypothetical protein